MIPRRGEETRTPQTEILRFEKPKEEDGDDGQTEDEEDPLRPNGRIVHVQTLSEIETLPFLPSLRFSLALCSMMLSLHPMFLLQLRLTLLSR